MASYMILTFTSYFHFSFKTDIHRIMYSLIFWIVSFEFVFVEYWFALVLKYTCPSNQHKKGAFLKSKVTMAVQSYDILLNMISQHLNQAYIS
jgi:hypothetical protein